MTIQKNKSNFILALDHDLDLIQYDIKIINGRMNG